MSKYILRGSYNEYSPVSDKKKDVIDVIVPLITASDSMLYGIDKAICDLKQDRIYPTEAGIDVLCLAALVYLADTRISRSMHSQNSWTREIDIILPVYDVDLWNNSRDIFSRILKFLTGDIWTISFTKRDISLADENDRRVEFDAVSLFSGGMDSLIGTINHLEQKHKVALISHAGDGYTKNTQMELLSEFQRVYTNNQPNYFNLWMVFGKDIVLEGGIENTTRSRSFLFIAYGLFALSGMANTTSLQVPENGLIALNVPLDDLRLGSHSTRTTHPFYMNLWNEAIEKLGMPFSVSNPYWNKTKGEMADECLNKDFLMQNLSVSISCSSPHKARWKKLPPQHCGYCVPCLIRRAAIHKAFGFANDPTEYWAEYLAEVITAHDQKKGEQLRSFQVAIKRLKDNPELRKILVHKSGRLDGAADYITQLSEVYYRGLLEVDSFIDDHLESEENNSSD